MSDDNVFMHLFKKTLSDNEQNSNLTLLNTHKPQFIFDSCERFFPSSVEYYLANSIQQIGSGNVVKSVGTINPNALCIYDITSQSTIITDHIRLAIGECQTGFTDDDLSSAPIYGSVFRHDTFTLLQFIVFFPFSDSQYACNFIPTTRSIEANFRFIHIKIFNDDELPSEVYFDGKFEYYYFNCQPSEHRIRCYPVAGSHELRSETTIGFCCLQAENDGFGRVWSPSVEYIETNTKIETDTRNDTDTRNKPNTENWTHFSGKIGDSVAPAFTSLWGLQPHHHIES